MFLSAESRKRVDKALSLPEQSLPQGEAFSPHIISLWNNSLISSEISQKKSDFIISPLVEKHIEKNTEKTPEVSSEISEKREESENISGTDFSLHTLPESLAKVPSREDQIAKVKQAMSQFEEISKAHVRSENRGFFRNLKKLI